jgi:hypothetical protein
MAAWCERNGVRLWWGKFASTEIGLSVWRKMLLVYGLGTCRVLVKLSDLRLLIPDVSDQFASTSSPLQPPVQSPGRK